MIIKTFEPENLSDYAKFCRLNVGLGIMPDFLFKEKTIDDFDFDPSLTLVAYDDSNERILGFIQSVIRERKEGQMGYIKLLCVDSENRVKGIGTELLKKVEKIMKKRGVKIIRVYESYPNYFMPGVDPYYTEAVCFFERNGYKKFGDTSNLICDLTLQNLYGVSLLMRIVSYAMKGNSFPATMESLERAIALNSCKLN